MQSILSWVRQDATLQADTTLELATLDSTRTANNLDHHGPPVPTQHMCEGAAVSTADENAGIWNNGNTDSVLFAMNPQPGLYQSHHRVLIVATVALVVVILLFTGSRTVSDANMLPIKEGTALEDAILRTTSDPSIMDHLNSPQRRALDWVQSNDGGGPSGLPINRLLTRYALATVYYSTGGRFWEHSIPFLTPEHECTWQSSVTNYPMDEAITFGVSCDDSDTVEQLYLRRTNLKGTIPEDIKYLSNLRVLDLTANEISGAVPEMPAMLQHLAWSYHYGTRGTIPEQIMCLEYLESLEMRGMDGTVPEISAPLQTLTLGGALSGTFPWISFSKKGNVRPLRSLDLSGNQFSGSVPWNDIVPSLPFLESLILRESGLSAGSELPLNGLENLRMLDLTGCRMVGSLPSSIAGMTKLTTLILYENYQLTGTLPSFLGALVELEKLDLSSNGFHGPIPPSLGSLKEMKELRLQHNQFSGQVPSELASLPAIERLLINDNKLSGDFEYFCDEVPCEDCFDDWYYNGDDWSWEEDNNGFVYPILTDCNNRLECSCCPECSGDEDQYGDL